MTIDSLVPGLAVLRNYDREWLRGDIVAGLSVAAVALPIGIAYAQLAGFPPVVGIYSCILPVVAYAIFGSSKQLVVNPDAAACSIVAATVAPLANGDSSRYLELSIVLTTFTGVLLILGGIGGLGVIANFLSRPILTGYLNGIALTIIAGQLGVIFGFQVESGGFFRTVYHAATQINETHLTTFALGVSLLAVIFLLKRFLPRVPAPLIAVVVGGVAVYAMQLASRGVSVVGTVPAGFPSPMIPQVTWSEVGPLAAGAGGIALVSFCSMMTTGRGFAAKNGYRINVNQDMFALGVSDLASAFNRGFVVSGADSRTAVADSAGGKTQVASVAAAVVMALVLLFLADPLAYIPTAALGAILISSALGLFDFAALGNYYRISKPEFRQSMAAMLGVMTIGVLPGVLVAVGLALFKLLRETSRPREAVLGLDGKGDAFISRSEGGKEIPRLLIYRFENSLLFFNADYFCDRVRALVREADPAPKYFLFDAESVPLLDITGAYALESLRAELEQQGIEMGLARADGEVHLMLERVGLTKSFGPENIHSTIYAAAKLFRERTDARQGTEL